MVQSPNSSVLHQGAITAGDPEGLRGGLQMLSRPYEGDQISPSLTLRSRLCLQRSVRDVTFVASQPSKRNSHDSDPTAHPHSGSWPLGNVARDVRHRYPCRYLLQPKLDFMSPMISTDHDELRQRLSKVAESSGAELCVLFGSRGRGSAGAGSDVDLALSYRTMPSPQQRLQIIGLFQPAAASCLYYPPAPFWDISH